jgi:hypothetical protein
MAAMTESKQGLRRVGAWMGVAFAVLFVAGFVAFNTPSNGKNAQQWARWWNDSGHRAGAIIGAYLMVLGILAFIWFASSLRDQFGEGGRLMFTFASVFAAVILVSIMVRAAIAGGKQFGQTPVPVGGDLARQFENIGFGMMLVAGGLAAGLFIGLASYLARRNGTLPGWLTIAGYVVAVLQLAAFFFFPFVLVPLWVLIAAITLLRRQGHTTAQTATT